MTGLQPDATGDGWIPQVTIRYIPKRGQEFDTEENAYTFYKEYAREGGFTIRKHSNKLGGPNKECVWRLLVCSREGITNNYYQENIKDTVERSGERNRGLTRCGCPAKLSIVKRVDTNCWVVSVFEEKHNHPLASPAKVRLMGSHREVTPAQRTLMHQFAEANVPTWQRYRILEADADDPSSVGCLERDLRNKERDERKELLGHDAESLIAYFEEEKARDENFYYAYDTIDDVFSCCFWADDHSRLAYTCFGDAVVFDTTYNTNKYGMIFAEFVGVNNHRQTTVFGCGLLSNEKIGSFNWLFTKFLDAMPNHMPPSLIITDQDVAITRSISEIFPTTFHRFCSWHISDKFAEKLGKVLYKEQYHNLNNVIKHSETPEEFESEWKHLMDATKLGDNLWLRNMYELRRMWVPAFVRHVFAAGMSSSQRVESNHAVFKRHVMKKNSLIDIMPRVQRAIRHQRQAEKKAELVDMSQTPRTTTSYRIEKQMSSVYTKAMFLQFQKEFLDAAKYSCTQSGRYDNLDVYLVEKDEEDGIFDRPRQLRWDRERDYISCSCKLFEFYGYLCRHTLCLMTVEQVKFIPDHYILKRWTKDAKSNVVYGSTTARIEGKSLVKRYGVLSHRATRLVNEASLTEARSVLLLQRFDDLEIEVKEVDDGGELGRKTANLQNMDTCQGTVRICDPTPVRTKGYGKRLKTGKEKAMSQSRRRCGNCKRTGHDQRTCPNRETRTRLADEEDASLYRPSFQNEDTDYHDVYVGEGSTYNYFSHEDMDYMQAFDLDGDQ